MNEQMPISDEFLPLLNAACDGTLDETQFSELAAALDSDVTRRKMFTNHVQLLTDMHILGRAERACDGGLARVQAILSQATQPFSPVFGFLPTNIGYLSSGWPVAYLVATVILLVGMAIGAVMHVSQPVQIATQSAPPLPSPLSSHPLIVGRITGMVDCRWEGRRKDEGGRMKDELPTAGTGIHPSSLLPHPSSSQSLVSLGDTFALSAGLMEITYDTGAKVILQGPVTYEVDSHAGGYLAFGKLTASVEKKERERQGHEGRSSTEYEVRSMKYGVRRNGQQYDSSYSVLPASPSPLSPLPSPLFAVRTPTATVTDLGTEFGVEVSKEGNTASHVFRGSVRVQALAANGEAEGDGRVLRENESATVKRAGNSQDGKDTVIVLGSSTEPAEFVRKIPTKTIKTLKTLDLVDIVAGGNGLGKARDRGIDPTTGETSSKQPDDLHLSSDGRYHKVPERPLIDGVFIPCPAKGPVQLDSAGHTFGGFGNANGKSWGYVWAGGPLPDVLDKTLPSRVMRGLDYSVPWHSLLGLHANKGITFDLGAIRNANSGYRLIRFSAAAGKSYLGDPGKCDVWVFVDGQVRFQREQLIEEDGELRIVVALDDQSRFLTLVATDGGDEPYCDAVIFGDPKLVIVEWSE